MDSYSKEKRTSARNLFGLVCILAFSTHSALTQKVVAAGVKTTADCNYALRPLVADLTGIAFPHDWTIVVACTPATWEYLQAKADAPGTNTAFTNQLGHVTVVRGMIYLELPRLGIAHPTPRVVLEHELGHILCSCNDEVKADRAAGVD